MPRDGRRGARLARREEGASLFYVTDEQRSQAGCISVQIGALISAGLPKDPPDNNLVIRIPPTGRPAAFVLRASVAVPRVRLGPHVRARSRDRPGGSGANDPVISWRVNALCARPAAKQPNVPSGAAGPAQSGACRTLAQPVRSDALTPCTQG